MCVGEGRNHLAEPLDWIVIQQLSSRKPGVNPEKIEFRFLERRGYVREARTYI
jgi:hypothetical protein